ncbi:MAG: YxeA family protein [bacterium]|nr:YxeA family protein [bacterium]MCM1423697.1 YxeA family protein [bacterium]
MKKKTVVGIAVPVIIAAGFICFCAWFLSESGSTYYYTQIDNSKVEEVNSRGGVLDLYGGMSFSYKLLSYHEKGKEKEITFGTSRKLREAAFLRLTVMPVRGVIEWSEMQYEELPEAVQRYYAAPEGK